MTIHKVRKSLFYAENQNQKSIPTHSHLSYPFQINIEDLDSKITQSRKMVFLAELFNIMFIFQAKEHHTFKIISEVIISLCQAQPNRFLDKVFSGSFNSFSQSIESPQLINILKKCHVFLLSVSSFTPKDQQKKCCVDRFLMNLYLKKIQS